MLVLALSLLGLSPGLALNAQDVTASRYSPEVIAKADKILEQIDLKRSGKTIVATNTSDISRAIAALARQRRQMKVVANEWEKANNHLAQLNHQMKLLNVQDGELNLQLARVAGVDAATNNRVVGLINAVRAKIRLLAKEIDSFRETVAQRRNELGQAESDYADVVLKIRRDFDTIHAKLEKEMKGQKPQIALNVLHRNFQTPPTKELDASKVLATLEKRIEKIEQAIFRESIPLEIDRNGSMYVNVVVGKKTARMVVDSGATLISLTSETANELGVDIPQDAPELKLVTADGREIPAKAVLLPRVRVGQFEAKDVRAAVLHPSANGAEPLLGMSYLGNFKFEINKNDKTLKMLRVSPQ